MAEILMNQFKALSIREFNRGNRTFSFCGQVCHIMPAHTNEYNVTIGGYDVCRLYAGNSETTIVSL